ncbi:MAG TPA: D-2-hydroxyacid dehydrogenase [Gemmataceae bacterium]|nr:D-2-hydroxyacid dehydrogenase [Gemmataceae bacterium]
MLRILLDVPLGDAVRALEALPGVKLLTPPSHEREWDLPDDLLDDPEVLLCRMPPRNLRAMTSLKFVQLTSVGYEHLRDFALADAPFRVCNARGVFDTAIAEWCVAMMINLTRDLPSTMRNQQAAKWERGERFAREVRGRTVGLWGYGGIGRETARLARALGMSIHALTRSGVKPRVNTCVQTGTGDPEGVLPARVFLAGQERAFLSGLDFLVLALPHTKHSDGGVGEAELRALPPTAYLLNPARGPIVQEQALVRALSEGWLAGAALDAHFAYPLPAEHPLWRLPNVILTPHVSGSDRSKDFPARMADLLAQNVARWQEGRPLLNEITSSEWREI